MLYRDGAYAETEMTVAESESSLRFVIAPAKGDPSVLPQKRSVTVVFRDVIGAKECTVLCDGKPDENAKIVSEDNVSVTLSEMTPQEQIEILLTGYDVLRNLSLKEHKIVLLSKLQGSNIAKKRYERLLNVDKSATAPAELKNAFAELNALWYEQ